MYVGVQQDYSPYTVINGTNAFIGSTWQQFTFPLTPTQPDTVRLTFNLAYATGDVWIDRISISSTNPVSVTQ